MGLYAGTGFAEITTPGQTVNVGYIAGSNSLWRDVRVYKHATLGDFAYAVSEGGGGIQVISLANIDSGSVTLVNTITSGPAPAATHSMEINQDTGFLYRSGGGSNGLRIYDLKVTPDAPVYVTSWTARYTHEVTLVNYTSGPLAGKEIAFACGGDNGGWANTGIDILDVTNKANITAVTPRVTWPNGQYGHQCTLSSDKTRLYLNDELWVPNLGGSTINFVFDISNLGVSAPTLLGSFDNGNSAIPHNEYTLGDHLFQASYTSGVRVYDLAQSSTNPPEIAWFDTRMSDDNPTFNGLWNVYPFHPGGVVTGSDLESGLFVWWVGAPQLSFSFPNGQPSAVSNLGHTLRVQITETQAGLLTAGTERLWYRTGGPWSSVALTSLGGGLYDATFPAVPCNTVFDYYITGTTDSNGIVWSSPDDAPNSFHSSTASICTTAPVVYCTAKLNSLGCTPSISFVGSNPSVSAGSGFTIQSANMRNNKSGLMFYSLTGRDSSAFQGGTLCVAAPIRRTPVSNSGGSPSGNDCSGAYSIDLNAFIFGGTGDPGLQVVGSTVRTQFWGRDPGFAAPNNTTLSNALEAQIAP
jgi:choice-of-anchor B domain-containing protein